MTSSTVFMWAMSRKVVCCDFQHGRFLSRCPEASSSVQDSPEHYLVVADAAPPELLLAATDTPATIAGINTDSTAAAQKQLHQHRRHRNGL